MSQQKNRLKLVDFFFAFLAGAFLSIGAQKLLGALALADIKWLHVLTVYWVQDLGFVLGVAVLLWLRKSSWRDLQLVWPRNWNTYVSAVLWGMVLYVLMLLAANITNWLAPGGLKPQAPQAALEANDSLEMLVFMVVTTAVLAPICEELLFRGLLFQSLCNHLSPNMAAVFASLIFGCAHFDMQRALPLALGGYVLNRLAMRYDSLIPGMIAHGVWNALMIVITYVAS